MYLSFSKYIIYPVGWAVEYSDSTSNEGPGYDTKQSEVPEILELWQMWSTPSLLSLPGPLLEC